MTAKSVRDHLRMEYKIKKRFTSQINCSGETSFAGFKEAKFLPNFYNQSSKDFSVLENFNFISKTIYFCYSRMLVVEETISYPWVVGLGDVFGLRLCQHDFTPFILIFNDWYSFILIFNDWFIFSSIIDRFHWHSRRYHLWSWVNGEHSMICWAWGIRVEGPWLWL